MIKKQVGNSIKHKKINRRVLAITLSLIMTIGLFNGIIFANDQINVKGVSVDSVYYSVGSDPLTGDLIIRPLMRASWEDQDQWAPAVDPADEHAPDTYTMRVDNKTTGLDGEIVINQGSDDFSNKYINLQDHIELETGSFYEITVIPSHYHEDDSDYAKYTGVNPIAYGVTDPQVGFESGESSITVIWDDMGITDAAYRISYALGSKTRDEIEDNPDGGRTVRLGDDGVNPFLDSVSRRHKLSYTFNQNIIPGKTYSFIIEPILSTYNGKAVTRNQYPVVHNVTTDIVLSYTDQGTGSLKLQWDIPSSYKLNSDGEDYTLNKVEIFKAVDEQASTIAILGKDAGALGRYIVEKPVVETEYYLKVTYKAEINGVAVYEYSDSNRLTYSPSQVEIIPTKPVVKELLPHNFVKPNTSAEIQEFEEEYLLPGSTYTGDYDKIFEEGITYHLDTESQAVNFVWGAFRRIDIDEASDTFGTTITDLNTYYDITMTDSYGALSTATKYLSNQRYSSLDDASLIKSVTDDIVGFRAVVDGYYESSTGTMQTIEPNKIYYIQVVAKKYIGETEIKSEPTIVSFYYNDEGDAYAPPLIMKPPLQVKEDETTSDGVTLKWRDEWYEIIDPTANVGDPLDTWATEVWIDGSTISTKPIDGITNGGDYYPVYEGGTVLTDLQTRLTGMGITSETRLIDLASNPFNTSSIRYKFYKIKYEDVLEEIEEQGYTGDNKFTQYFDELVKKNEDVNNRDLLNWKRIEPYLNSENLDEILYREEGLEANTSYLFILYPYRVLNSQEVLEAHYPTPIIVSTNPEDVIINPDPMVPSLHISDTQETSISLYWKYFTDFEYEVRYSLTDNVEDAKDFDIELPENQNDPGYPKDGSYKEIQIADLFPDTGYYFFIRAKSVENNTSSLWSNPVFAMTEDVAIPEPPRGLGVAPEELMREYNYEESVTADYIAVQWLRDTNDVEGLEGANVKTYYSYILEVANNEKFVDPIYVVSGSADDEIRPENVQLLEKTLAKVNELVSNRHYYFRMKTRVTVIGNEKGQLIIKESDYYSPTIRVITVASDNEYDSGSDPELEIIPSEDFEIIYDPGSQELIYRFRDNDTDGDGYNDNNVEQRLITNLIKQNAYSYNIDIANYDNKPIVKRKVIIPYAIIEAFDSYEIELKVDAGKLLINIPHDALMDEVNRQKNQYGVAPTIELMIEDVDAYYDHSQMPEEALAAVSVPQEMDIRIKSKRTSTLLDYSDVPIELGLSTNNRYELYGREPVVYALDPERRWEEVEGDYDREEGAFMLSTRNIGSYGVFLTEGSKEIVSTKPSHWSEAYKKVIDDKYTVLGLEGYNPDGKIPENQFINVCYSLITENKTIDVTRYISTQQLNELYYAGIKTDTSKGQSSISRQEAIAMMMETIELREGQNIKADTSLLTAVNNNGAVNNAYKEAIAKAATIGLVSDLNALRPSDGLTYGEFFALWAKAEGDAQ